MAQFQVKLRGSQQKTFKTVKFTRNENFEPGDKISVLEEALGNKKLKVAYGLKNKKTFQLESNKTFKDCLKDSGNTAQVIDALNSGELSVVAFIAEQ